LKRLLIVFGFFAVLGIVVNAEAQSKISARGRQQVKPAAKKGNQSRPTPSLKGTAGGSQRRQNRQADAEDLSRIKDAEFKNFVAAGLLVPISENSSIDIDRRLKASRRYARPWTRTFLLNFAASFKAKFGKKLKVTSAVRTVEDQVRLHKRNGNASLTSTHPTGSTLDISWKGMSKEQVAWVTSNLIALRNQGKLEAVREMRQACFHIMVFKKYAQVPQVKKPAPQKQTVKKGGRK